MNPAVLMVSASGGQVPMEPLRIIVEYWNPISYILPIMGALLVLFIGGYDIFEKVEQSVFVRVNSIVPNIFIGISEWLFRVIEVGGMDGLINKGIPRLFTSLYHRVKKVQTGVLSYNILYVMLLLVLLIIVLTLRGG